MNNECETFDAKKNGTKEWSCICYAAKAMMQLIVSLVQPQPRYISQILCESIKQQAKKFTIQLPKKSEMKLFQVRMRILNLCTKKMQTIERKSTYMMSILNRERRPLRRDLKKINFAMISMFKILTQISRKISHMQTIRRRNRNSFSIDEESARRVNRVQKYVRVNISTR